MHGRTLMDGNSYRNGRVHVRARRCPTCVFRHGNLMHLDGMIAEAEANESAIICHDTLDGDNAVCRGFFDLHPTQPLQIAARLDLVTYT